MNHETDSDGSESSDSDDDWGTKKKTTRRKLKQRRTIGKHVYQKKIKRTISSYIFYSDCSDAISANDYARHSTRTRKVTNYNLNDIYGLSDEDEDTVKVPIVKEDEQEDEDAIEMVLDHKVIEGSSKVV